jgi:hypothetical protein
VIARRCRFRARGHFHTCPAGRDRHAGRDRPRHRRGR